MSCCCVCGLHREFGGLARKVQSAPGAYPVLMGHDRWRQFFWFLPRLYVVPTIAPRSSAENQAKLPAYDDGAARDQRFHAGVLWLAGVGTVLIIVDFDPFEYRTPAGACALIAYILAVPYFGKVIKKVAVARFLAHLGDVVDQWLPLLTSLDIVKNVVSNLVLSQAIEDARASIREARASRRL